MTDKPDTVFFPSSSTNILSTWRERIFFVIFLTVILMALVPYIASALRVIHENKWGILVVYTLGYLSVIVILLLRRIPFRIRVMIGLATFYSIGLTALITIGPLGSGRMWLFAFSIIASLLLGLRAGFVTLAINIFTLFILGYLLTKGQLQWASQILNPTKIWVIISITFILLNTVVTVSLAVLVNALEQNILEGQKMTMALTETNEQLKQDQQKRKSIEEQLRQAHKMESVGRLAGGVAHDYNNILSVIIGFTELSMDTIDPSQQIYGHLNEVLKAANRATDITRQLLAFARKQTIAPKVIDLNENIENMLKMLRRLIGEDINLTWLPGESLWNIKIDPTQIDQILANLCVNARDSISGVGKITIETDTVVFDASYCADNYGFIPGAFVMLVLSDNGCGMDKEVMDNIFEPFFTTKTADKGTGLGLATVYGIVKQNNGFINVYSEPGVGTSVKIYLPRHEGDAIKTQKATTEEIPTGHNETILIVEDDPAILKLTRQVLGRLGYTVLTAGTPARAIRLAEECAGKVHLLVTDVIMPEMNGRELADTLLSVYPDLKCMFMSGYTANVIAHHGVLDEGVYFVQKPFSKQDLAKTVRKVLDEDKKLE